MPPLKLPFMFSPIYRINVIADVCHGKVFLPQGLPGGRSVPHDWTQCNFACITLRRRTCGSAVLCDESLCYFPGRNRSPPFQICSSPKYRPDRGRKHASERGLKYVPRAAAMRVCVFLARLISSSSYFLAGSAFQQGFIPKPLRGAKRDSAVYLFTLEAAGSLITPVAPRKGSHAGAEFVCLGKQFGSWNESR